MRTIDLFEKYTLNEEGTVTNKNTGNIIKVEEKNGNRYVKLYLEGKTKRINITPIMEENFPQIVEEEIVEENLIQLPIIKSNLLLPIMEEKLLLPIMEEKNQRNYSSRKYVIRVTELDGTIREFKSFKKANDFYGLRKDYLNYCLTEPFFYMLTKNGLNLKSVEKVNIK